ncbi:hypothetical protein GQ607_003892 [Colletotrichum asianum]|uniref:Uncharacterized protein n=1 Tax=Colletotrichum asianum TaxID=702518 RepID=A0A8H3ZV86_9PEZI|nr:hypothetical protein GQ607_003892 [Colletotrichum asianum]
MFFSRSAADLQTPTTHDAATAHGHLYYFRPISSRRRFPLALQPEPRARIVCCTADAENWDGQAYTKGALRRLLPSASFRGLSSQVNLAPRLARVMSLSSQI